MKSVHLLRFQLLGTQIGLLDKEHDVGRISLLDDALELIGRDSGIQLLSVGNLSCRNNTFGYRYTGEFIRFAASLNFESELQFRFPHSGNVFEINRHGNNATHFVRNGLVVAFYLFPLVNERSSGSFTIGINQIRSYGYYRFFVEILFGESSGNGCGNLATNYFKRRRGHRKIIGRQRLHVFVTPYKCQCHEHHEGKIDFLNHNNNCLVTLIFEIFLLF